MILFTNCRFIPELTEGYDKEYGHLLVGDDNRILKIFDKVDKEKELWISDEKLRIVDVNYNTMLPGFFELHTHLCLTDLDFQKIRNRSGEDTVLEMYDFAREYLRQGYTTIRDAGTTHNATVALKKAKEKGYINIPDIISSGQIITPTETGNETFEPMYYEADSPYEVRKGCRKQFQLGNDIIKYMVTGSYLNEAGNPGDLITCEEELCEAIKTAKLKGSYVMAHAHGKEGIKLAIKAGVRTIEHGSFIDDEAIMMLKNTEDTFLVPTAAIGIACLDDDGENISEDMLEKSKKYEIIEKECINKAYNAGLILGFGSDIDKWNFVNHPGMEFYARTEWFDFKYKDILIQATKNSAKIAGLDEEKGTLKVGKKAELVVIAGKPDEDIYLMKKLPMFVFFNGELISNFD